MLDVYIYIYIYPFSLNPLMVRGNGVNGEYPTEQQGMSNFQVTTKATTTAKGNGVRNRRFTKPPFDYAQDKQAVLIRYCA